MPTKRSKPAGLKYQAPRFPAKVREAAASFAKATTARKKLGKAALGKPKSSKIHKTYEAAKRTYQAAGKKLSTLTGHTWKVKRK
jgi:hypothetical protein